MNALDDSAIDVRFTKIQQTFLRWTLYEEYKTLANLWKMNAEDTRITHELARQSEAKLKKAPQSEANVCRRRRQTKMKSQKNLPY